MGVRFLFSHALLAGWGWGGEHRERAFSPSLPPSLAFLGTEGGPEAMPFPQPQLW